MRQLDGFEARRATGIFRLPLDRAFVIKGHGAVVTGTAMGGNVATGQKLRVLPGGHEVRVRSIQVHGQSVEKAGLCQRVALNLTGAEKIELKRGSVLADDRLDVVTERLDATVEIRPSAKRALKNNERIRLFIGTAETMGRAIILDERGSIAPKTRGLAQLVLDEPVVALSGDRFVIRDQTNVRTLGGGQVLNPLGRRVRKPLDAYRKNLAALVSASGPDAAEALLNLQNTLALSPARAAQLLNLPLAEAENALRDSRFVKLSMGDEEGCTTRSKWADLKAFTLAALSAHHKAPPLSPGLEMEALRSRLPYEVAPRAFRGLVDRLAHETEIVREESTLRLRQHRVKLGGDESKLGARIEDALRKAEFHPPDLKQLAEALKLPPGEIGKLRTVLGALEREGKVVKIATDLYFGRGAFDSARARLVDCLKKQPQITAAEYRDLLGASRKFAIALLDHFDHSGVTTRVGDVRRLRSPAS